MKTNGCLFINKKLKKACVRFALVLIFFTPAITYISFFFKFFFFLIFIFPIFSVTFTLPFLKPHSDNRRFKQPQQQQQQQQPASGVPGDHARVPGGDHTRVSTGSQVTSNGGVQIHQPQHRPQQHTNGVLLKASQKDLQSKYHLLSKTNKTVMGWVG